MPHSNAQRDASQFPGRTRSDPLSPTTLSAKLFTGLDQESIHFILDAAQIKQFTSKQTIVTESEKATHLFLLERGRVRYYKLDKSGHQLLLLWFVPGDIFGLRTLFSGPMRNSGTAEAITRGEVWEWDYASVRRLIGLYPLLAENGFRILLGYMEAYGKRHAGLLTRTAEQRLADTLLDLGHRSGHAHPKGVEIDITNEHLGALADVGLFTTSRLLSGWQRKGAVSKMRGKILIRSPEFLLIE